jgi:xanthine dehydrogenase FAD-binding subunit
MTIWQEYILANSISQALQALENAQSPARLVAGGTDLLLGLQQERCPPVHTLVDISTVEELQAIELRGSELFIGAAVPLTRLVASSLVKGHAPALVQACELVGGPQVRNMATLGGNVAHALPAADGSIALLALDARVEITSLHGSRHVPLSEFFLAPGQSIISGCPEILVGFYLPQAVAGTSSAFARVMRPQGVALPILNMAAWLQRQNERIQNIHLAIGPAGRVPCRASQVEQFLVGKDLTCDDLKAGADILVSSVTFRTSPQRATAAYRQHLARALLEQVVQKAWLQTFIE